MRAWHWGLTMLSLSVGLAMIPVAAVVVSVVMGFTESPRGLRTTLLDPEYLTYIGIASFFWIALWLWLRLRRRYQRSPAGLQWTLATLASLPITTVITLMVISLF
jgi:hypothetical protein